MTLRFISIKKSIKKFFWWCFLAFFTTYFILLADIYSLINNEKARMKMHANKLSVEKNENITGNVFIEPIITIHNFNDGFVLVVCYDNTTNENGEVFSASSKVMKGWRIKKENSDWKIIKSTHNYSNHFFRELISEKMEAGKIEYEDFFDFILYCFY